MFKIVIGCITNIGVKITTTDIMLESSIAAIHVITATMIGTMMIRRLLRLLRRLLRLLHLIQTTLAVTMSAIVTMETTGR